MFRGDRGVILAAVGWIVLLGAAPPHKESPSAKTEQQEKSATAPTGNYAAYPDKYADSCYQAKDHDTADLCAQWRAAVAAEKAAESGWWGNLIGGFGGVLSFVSVVLVVMALRQTEKSLAQAREANSIAKNSAIRQLRAYLGIESVIVESRSVIKLRVRNFGQTPAVNVKMITRHMIDENGEWFPVNHPFGMVDPDHCVTGVIRAGTYGPTLPTKPCKLHIKIAISYDDQMGGKWNREATFYLADWLFKKMPWELHVYPDTAKETEREE